MIVERLHPDVALEAWELARDRLTAYSRARYPDWSDEQVQREVAARLGR